MQKVHKLGKRKPAWLAVPLALVLGGATALLWPQSPTHEVLVAKTDLSSGTVVSASNFEPRRVQLGDSASLYFSDLPTEGVLVARITKGELLTRTNLIDTPLNTRIPTVLTFKDTLPANLKIGSQVDIWATEQAGEPAPIALECEVTTLRAEVALGQKATAVEVNCLPEFLPPLLRAKASQAAIALVLQSTMLDQ